VHGQQNVKVLEEHAAAIFRVTKLYPGRCLSDFGGWSGSIM